MKTLYKPLLCIFNYDVCLYFSLGGHFEGEVPENRGHKTSDAD